MTTKTLPFTLPSFRQVRGSDWELRKTVFWLALPAVGEQVLNTAVGLVDQFLVGHLDTGVAAALGYDRATALASVGLANMLIWITTTLFMAVAVGATTLVARRTGEGRSADANTALRQAMLIAMVVGAVGTIANIVLAEPILALLGANADVASTGASYLRIISLSFIPTALMFSGTAALRGAGDTRSPLLLMTIVNLINIAVSWLLVNGTWGFPALGVGGAAIGTAIGRAVGALVLTLMFVRGKTRLSLAGSWRPEWNTIRKLWDVGAPSAGEQFIFQGAVVVMTGFITGLGTVAFAAHTVTLSIESVSFLPGFGFGIAATALVGQSLGAGDPERAKQASWEALRQGGALMTGVGLILAMWPATIISWIAPDPAVIEQATPILRLAGLGQLPLAFAFVLVGALRGAGDTRWPLLMRVISTWVVRVPLLLFLMYFTDWGLFGIWVAMFVDFLVQAVLAVRRFQAGHWQSIQI